MQVASCLELAVEAAREAAGIQMEALGKPHTIGFKGETDLVTEVDRACESAIVRKIRSAFPDHGFLLEESRSAPADSPFLWIVDPLDGTTNYAHGFPHFCTSIALRHKGLTVAGVVLDPVRNELFTAVRGGGALLNGEAIRVSREGRLIRCLLATGFPKNIREARDANLRRFSRLIRQARSVRRSGSAALDLCYVAAGRIDGYWVLELAPWDAAAGLLVVSEAGGRATSFSGSSAASGRKGVVASNGRIHAQLLRLLTPRPG
ncbi:MAG: inositol monophosphatase family protein [bacterium]